VRTRSNSVGETFGNQLAQYFQLWWVMDLWTFRQKSEAHSSKLSCTTYRHHGQKCISAKRADFETFTCSLCIYTKLKMTKKMLKFNNQIFINSHAKWPSYWTTENYDAFFEMMSASESLHVIRQGSHWM
jgi:hypothetical protein